MLYTAYLFVASEWEDEDLPVTYEFSYESLSGGYLVHRPRLELSHSSSLLPRGRSDVLSTRVRVFDVLDGEAMESQGVEVLEVVMSVGDKESFLLSSLSTSEGDVDEMSKSISLGSSLLNSVDCSGAEDCGELNRESCSTTVGTCGECVAGYVGESGHANSVCVSLVDMSSSRRLSETDRRSCVSDGDCRAGQWEVCDLKSNECVLRSKSCSNNCSNHGRCDFVARYNSSMSFSSCTVLDVECEARCVCDEGFRGGSCDLVEEEFESLVASKHQLVEALDRMSAL
jgi:hypothetical protein